jgi:hypothetical protein
MDKNQLAGQGDSVSRLARTICAIKTGEYRERLNVINDMFTLVNHTYFNRSIPPPLFYLDSQLLGRDGRIRAGYVKVSPPSMHISIPYHAYFGWSAEELLDTVKHEMVHLYLYALNKPWGHTEDFLGLCAGVGARRYAHSIPFTS